MTKKQTPKKTSSKKASTKQKGKLETKRVLVGAATLVVGLLVAIIIAYFTTAAVLTHQADARYDRIMGIYSSLNLDAQSYIQQNSNVFGDKRPYDYDKSRSQSSYITYSHGDTVSNTVKDLDTAIKAAGFKFIDEPYPGMLGSVQYHYKNDEGVYIRLTVDSTQYAQATQNAHLMGDSNGDKLAEIQKTIDFNAGPSTVTIKVNLDDNNE